MKALSMTRVSLDNSWLHIFTYGWTGVLESCQEEIILRGEGSYSDLST